MSDADWQAWLELDLRGSGPGGQRVLASVLLALWVMATGLAALRDGLEGGAAVLLTVGVLCGLPGILMYRSARRAGRVHPLLAALASDPAAIVNVTVTYQQDIVGYVGRVAVTLRDGGTHTVVPPRGEEAGLANWIRTQAHRGGVSR